MSSMSSKSNSKSNSKLQISPHLPYSKYQPQLAASSSSQTENRHKQQAASPIAKHSTTTYTIHSFQKPAVQLPPPSPLRSTLSHTTTSYHRHRSIAKLPHHQSQRESRPYVKHLHTFLLSQPLSPHRALPPSHIAALPHKLKLLLLAAHLDTIGVTSLQTRSASPAAVTTAS
jgi:hypothetical protein